MIFSSTLCADFFKGIRLNNRSCQSCESYFDNGLLVAISRVSTSLNSSKFKMDSGFYFSFASALDTTFYFALEVDFGFGYGLGLVLNAAEVTLSILLSIC